MLSKKFLMFLLKSLVSVGLLILLFSHLEWRALRSLIVGVNFWLLALAVVLMTADRFLMAAKWGYLLNHSGQVMGFWRRVQVYYVSGFIGLGIPLGGFGGDMARMLITRSDPIANSTVVLSIVAERIHGLAATIAVGAAATLGYWLLLPELAPDALSGALLASIGFGGLGLAAIVWGVLFYPKPALEMISRLDWLPFSGRVRDKIAKLSPQLDGERRTRNLKFALWTVLEQFIPVATFYLTARAMHVEIGLLPTLAVVPINTFLQRLLPISFAGVGFRETVYVVLFASLGIGMVESVGVSLIEFSTFIFSLLPGLVMLLMTGKPAGKPQNT